MTVSTNTAPEWAIDPDAPIPVAYDFTPSEPHPHAFRLGEPERCVIAKLGDHWQQQPVILISYAAKAWHELVGEECHHDMAELIAKGWIKAAASTWSKRPASYPGSLH